MSPELSKNNKSLYLRNQIKSRLPTPSEFLDLEEKALKRIMQLKEVQECPALIVSLRQARSRFKKIGYVFHSIIEVKKDPNLINRQARIAIGAAVTLGQKNKYKLVSYSMSLILNNISKNTDCMALCFQTNGCETKPRIVRRFHFDYDAANLKDHPMFHLQYGGIPEDPFKKYHYCLDKKVVTPRLFFYPMSLSLLLDLTIREFNTELGKKLLSKGEWINIVKESEEKILKPYFDTCYDYFKKAGTREDSHCPSFIQWHYSKES